MAYTEPYRHRHLLVFDIETVPDTDAVYNLTGETFSTDDERREALENYHLGVTDGKNGFPRQMFHKVVAISVLSAEIEYLDDGTESYSLKHLGSNHKDVEKDVVAGFFKYITQLKPRLISYNGRGFDLPVLKYRAMAHGIAAPWFYRAGNKWESYQSRYSADWHCDLLEVLSDFGASSRAKLNEVCAVMGLPGKFGVDGSQVQSMYSSGQLQAIRDYCETDVLNTYLVYLRTMQHQGRISTPSYNRAVAEVIHYIESHGEEKPSLLEFMAAWADASGSNFMLDEVAA